MRSESSRKLILEDERDLISVKGQRKGVTSSDGPMTQLMT